jgi:Glycosyl transferase family 2
MIVTNFNYERFIDQAIMSALNQHYGNVHVVVVDDGSVDGSRDRIAQYGARVHTVLQPNLGQKAAFNAGFAACNGDIVMFLDADDTLEPDVVGAVADAFRRHPTAARVTFRLAVIDDEGRRTGAVIPPDRPPRPSGDVRASVLAFPDDLAWPPTSGNAFAAWVLRRIFPLPLDDERAMADQDLHTLTPLFGPVVALDHIGGEYRIHGTNAHARERFDVERSRVLLQQTARTHAALLATATGLGYPAVQPCSVTFAAHRLLSLRMARSEHPFAGDSRRRALAAGVSAAIGRFDVGMQRRIGYVVWFLLVAIAPARFVPRLADIALQSPRPARKGR